MAKKPETVFKDRIKPQLESLPKTWIVKVQQVAICGTPDFLLCVNGRFVALELKKSESDDASQLQHWNLRKIAACGGVGLVVSPENWQTVLDFLTEIANTPANQSLPIEGDKGTSNAGKKKSTVH